MRATWIVLGLFAALVGLATVLPRIIGSSDSHYRPVMAEVSTIRAMLDRFRLDCGRYPTTREGLHALIRPPVALKDRWQGPYTNTPIQNDPWNNPYVYAANANSCILISYGDDGRPGGEGYGVDVTATE